MERLGTVHQRFWLLVSMVSVGCATAEDPSVQTYVAEEGSDGSDGTGSGEGEYDDPEDVPEEATGGGLPPGSDSGTGDEPAGTETGDEPESEATTGSPGSDTTTGGSASGCSGDGSNITSIGWVEVSSVFDPFFGSSYPADLSVDGNQGTSWFSAGPESDGAPTFFKWITQSNACIQELQIIGNGNHNNADFRQGFGFESVTVRMYDTSGSEVFRETYGLPGTPDPTVEVVTGGVEAHRIELYLDGHESNDCGGFSELMVYGG